MSATDICLHFIKECAAGRASQAFADYGTPSLVHHNAFCKSDAASLSSAMDHNAVQHPHKRFVVLRTIAQGDLVAIHSAVYQHASDAGIVVVHIFRMEGLKIAELWDIAMQIPEPAMNQAGVL